jgi:hypothetical protein
MFFPCTMLVYPIVVAVVLTIAVRGFLEEESTSPGDFDILFNPDEPNLFADVFDSPPTKNLGYDDLSLGSLQPKNEDTFENVVLSPEPLASLSSYQTSPCQGDNPLSLFGRSSGSDLDVGYISQSNLCYQDPAKVQPPIVLPKLFDLLPPNPEPDPVDLYPGPVFPRRPVCPGLTYMFRLCCDRGSTREVEDCVTCTFFTLANRLFFYIMLMCVDSRLRGAQMPRSQTNLVLHHL